jgi:uncharacterized protein (DUF362 family)
MMSSSRRSFLRRLALLGGATTSAWMLSACGDSSEPAARPVEVSKPDIEPSPAAPLSSPSPASRSTQPHLAVARGPDPETLVRRAIAALGGMEQFVKPGANVVIKPNICVGYHTYEYAATTNPWVIGALVKLCREAGADRVRVMDYPFGGTAEQAYTISGIREQVVAAGGAMEPMRSMKFVETEIPDGKDIRQWSIYEDVLTADLVINVPIAKHHSLARLTLGMKNLLGVVEHRQSMHRNMGQRLADLTSRVRPALTVIDAVRILTAHGPTGGNLDDVKQLDTVIASRDIVAADSYAATLFGLAPDDLAYVRAGVEMGLGRSDLANLKIEEIAAGG